MEIDVVGTFSMSRAAFDALKQSGDAVIINISATLHYGLPPLLMPLLLPPPPPPPLRVVRVCCSLLSSTKPRPLLPLPSIP